jgi:hypothetical protein
MSDRVLVIIVMILLAIAIYVALERTIEEVF